VFYESNARDVSTPVTVLGRRRWLWRTFALSLVKGANVAIYFRLRDLIVVLPRRR